ncbi:hypothetical protein PIB30_058894, partial [Stylosanthes scabra]|nr:hypothetical protein [Stylosanthes scabra]
MGRALLSSFLADLVSNIKSITFQTKHSIVKPLRKVMATLLILDDLVDYAEVDQFRGGSYGRQVKDWLDELQDALYKLEELLVEILTTISSSDPQPLQEFEAKILDNLENLESMVEEIDVLGLTVEPGIKRWMESSGGFYSTSPVLYNSKKDDLFVGRGKQVKTILKYLLSTPSESEEHIKVINIVGLPGVGKTTLVDAVCSNRKVRESFERRARISGLYRTTANLMVKNILAALGRISYYGDDLDLLCMSLVKRLGGKKCLLVLDDIKIDDSLENWSKVIASFERGVARGSAIILTSTIPHDDQNLLKITASLTVRLDLLSKEDWLSIFMSHASNRHTKNVPEIPKEAGEIMVNKLGALPLAAKMMGSLVQDKLEDKILSEFLDEVNLLPIPLDADD